jgi:hypothetical protein
VIENLVELVGIEPTASSLRTMASARLNVAKAAQRIDPNFHSSQLGIADTYNLMGQQKKARQEYFNAWVLATDKATELQDVLQSAFTYVRDRDSLGADLAFEGVAQQAHRAAVPVIEAEAWRMRARVQFIITSADLVGIDSPHAGKHFALIHREHLQRLKLNIWPGPIRC